MQFSDSSTKQLARVRRSASAAIQRAQHAAKKLKQNVGAAPDFPPPLPPPARGPHEAASASASASGAPESWPSCGKMEVSTHQDSSTAGTPGDSTPETAVLTEARCSYISVAGVLHGYHPKQSWDLCHIFYDDGREAKAFWDEAGDMMDVPDEEYRKVDKYLAMLAMRKEIF